MRQGRGEGGEAGNGKEGRMLEGRVEGGEARQGEQGARQDTVD